ncbi:hypothetical protein ACE6H2_008746 [Prunus campanulata]
MTLDNQNNEDGTLQRNPQWKSTVKDGAYIQQKTKPPDYNPTDSHPGSILTSPLEGEDFEHHVKLQDFEIWRYSKIFCIPIRRYSKTAISFGELSSSENIGRDATFTPFSCGPLTRYLNICNFTKVSKAYVEIKP